MSTSPSSAAKGATTEQQLLTRLASLLESTVSSKAPLVIKDHQDSTPILNITLGKLVELLERQQKVDPRQPTASSAPESPGYINHVPDGTKKNNFTFYSLKSTEVVKILPLNQTRPPTLFRIFLELEPTVAVIFLVFWVKQL